MLSSVEVRRFHNDQLNGLREVGWTFSMEVRPVSVEQLYDDKATRPLFEFVHELRRMKDICPVAREVAINPSLNPDSILAVFLPGSGNLPFDDQLEKLETYVRKLRSKSLKTGTLDGVDFAVDHASVYVQLDFENRKRRKLKLIVNGWARTINEIFFDSTSGSLLARVGRNFSGDQLDINEWFARRGNPDIMIIPVASPAGNR